MLTDEEALRKAESEYMMNGSPEFRAGFKSALAWLRSQGEPVAWMSPGKERLEFSRPDTVYGSHTIPLFLAPQPAVPDGWQLVPVEPTEEMCLAYTKCKTEAGEKWARHQWAAMLATAPEPKSC